MPRLMRTRTLSATQRGLSIVEMLVGVAVGLIVVAAATVMVAGQLADNRRLLLETQIQQDLRTTADLISRDLRRAGFWWASTRGTAAGGAALGRLDNPYAAVSPVANAASASEVTYNYAHPSRPVDDNVVNDDEVYGFRLRDGVIETALGRGNWQALTDAATLRITRFVVTPEEQAVVLPCFRACSPGGTPCPPVQTIRAYSIDIAGQAVSDVAVQRSVRVDVRLRNDLVTGECRD
jgi:prepilin peptidase dependent protein B